MNSEGQCAKDLEHLKKSQSTLKMYAERSGAAEKWYQKVGQAKSEDTEDYPYPQQHPSRGTNDGWKQQIKAHGPIGLLIGSAIRCGAKINHLFIMLQPKEQDIDLINIPCQFLGNMISELP